MKAYIVTEQEEFACVVAFGKTAVEARRHGANELGVDFESEITCTRAAGLDQYAAVGWVPAQVLVEEYRWRYECANCSKMVDADYFDDDEEAEMHPVYEGSHVFCSPACHEDDLARRAAAKALFDEMSAELLAIYPGVTPKWNMNNPEGLAFMFPGGINLCFWTRGEKTVRMYATDGEAWRAFRGQAA